MGYHAHDMTDKLHLVLRRWCLAFGILCIFFPVRKSGVWRFVRDVYRLGRRPKPNIRQVPPTPTGPASDVRGLYLTSAFEVFHRLFIDRLCTVSYGWVDRRRLHNPALTVARLSSVLARSPRTSEFRPRCGPRLLPGTHTSQDVSRHVSTSSQYPLSSTQSQHGVAVSNVVDA